MFHFRLARMPRIISTRETEEQPRAVGPRPLRSNHLRPVRVATARFLCRGQFPTRSENTNPRDTNRPVATSSCAHCAPSKQKPQTAKAAVCATWLQATCPRHKNRAVATYASPLNRAGRGALMRPARRRNSSRCPPCSRSSAPRCESPAGLEERHQNRGGGGAGRG